MATPESALAALRSYRVAGMALFDWTASLLAAALIGRFALRLRAAPEWIAWIFAWTAFGVLVHVALGVPTMLGYYLGLNARPARSAETDTEK